MRWKVPPIKVKDLFCGQFICKGQEVIVCKSSIPLCIIRKHSHNTNKSSAMLQSWKKSFLCYLNIDKRLRNNNEANQLNTVNNCKAQF